MAALSVFPSALYKRLLKATKCIDKTNSQCAFQSILCGKPSILYSYETGKNIEIGTSSYSLYDKLVSIMNDGEYSTPNHIYPISFYSIARNTARLCSNRSKKNEQQKNKYSIFSNYCQDLVLTKDELIEVVNNFEALAVIARKQNKSREKQNTNIDPLTLKPPKNTFSCDIIDWTQNENINLISNKPSQSQSPLQSQSPSQSVKKKKVEPILEYIPKTLQDDSTLMWKDCILFQHPLSTMSQYNHNKDNDIQYLFDIQTKIEPHLLLGLFAKSTHPKLKLTGRKEENCRISIMLNGEKTLMNLGDVIQNDRDFNNAIISTFHGVQNVPDSFLNNPLFIGGDDISTIEILTINPYCKGVGIMNNKIFWNPDLKIAERIIQSGYGTLDQFRFFKGKMKWNNSLYTNIQDRNLYGFIFTQNNNSASFTTLAKQIWAYHSKEDNNYINSLWYHILKQCWNNDTKDIESWMQIYNLINQNQCNIKQEMYQLMQIHDSKIAQQVESWKKSRIPRT